MKAFSAHQRLSVLGRDDRERDREVRVTTSSSIISRAGRSPPRTTRTSSRDAAPRRASRRGRERVSRRERDVLAIVHAAPRSVGGGAEARSRRACPLDRRVDGGDDDDVVVVARVVRAAVRRSSARGLGIERVVQGDVHGGRKRRRGRTERRVVVGIRGRWRGRVGVGGE